MSEFNVQKSIKAQSKYCERTGSPHFAPHSGVCWNCRRNIYEAVEQKRILYWELGQPEQSYTTGINTKKAGEELVTGCPHCNRSYCD